MVAVGDGNDLSQLVWVRTVRVVINKNQCVFVCACDVEVW